jgi:hypothetical protein
VSNLIGGIAFYYGTLERVDGRKNEEKDVFSATPSRQIFPRGFLWDEGYH